MLEKEFIPADAEGFEPTRARSVEDSLNDKILVEKVMRALGELTSQQRLIFLLKHREGMTYDEIARSLGCSAGTVKKSLFRAVLKLRERLGISAEADSYAPFVTGEGC
jgi:RNA polymerase sigma-70 factor (ECF subfamily)